MFVLGIDVREREGGVHEGEGEDVVGAGDGVLRPVGGVGARDVPVEGAEGRGLRFREERVRVAAPGAGVGRAGGQSAEEVGGDGVGADGEGEELHCFVLGGRVRVGVVARDRWFSFLVED